MQEGNLNILFGRVFGIGNAVMSIPAIKHYRDNGGHNLTVLVGTTNDDYGSYDILRMISGIRVLTDKELIEKPERFDVGVLSIPHDGRWISLFSSICDSVVDGRTRPDPTTFGFSSWKKHEALYQLEVAESITNTKSEKVDSSFFESSEIPCENSVFLGVGYKRDSANFWNVKHWGDENFFRFAQLVLSENENTKIVLTGNSLDIQNAGRLVAMLGSRVTIATGIRKSIELLWKCGSYVGNDTGMMHVAASMNKKVIGIFNLEGTETKNPPLCDVNKVILGYHPHSNPSAKFVYDTWKELLTK